MGTIEIYCRINITIFQVFHQTLDTMPLQRHKVISPLKYINLICLVEINHGTNRDTLIEDPLMTDGHISHHIFLVFDLNASVSFVATITNTVLASRQVSHSST